jgi:hypothetical protein
MNIERVEEIQTRDYSKRMGFTDSGKFYLTVSGKYLFSGFNFPTLSNCRVPISNVKIS